MLLDWLTVVGWFVNVATLVGVRARPYELACPPLVRVLSLSGFPELWAISSLMSAPILSELRPPSSYPIFFPNLTFPDLVDSPALQLMGVNVTATRADLDVSLELLSRGMLPDSLGKSPKLLKSLKDFADTDKRLDSAYRRQASSNA